MTAPRDATEGPSHSGYGGPFTAPGRGLQLEHQVGAVERGCGGEALSGGLEPAHDALEGRGPRTGHRFAAAHGGPAPVGRRPAFVTSSGGFRYPRRHLGEVDHRLRNAVEVI